MFTKLDNKCIAHTFSKIVIKFIVKILIASHVWLVVWIEFNGAKTHVCSQIECK